MFFKKRAKGKGRKTFTKVDKMLLKSGKMRLTVWAICHPAITELGGVRAEERLRVMKNHFLKSGSVK